MTNIETPAASDRPQTQRKRQTTVAGVSGPQLLDADLEASIADALKDLGL